MQQVLLFVSVFWFGIVHVFTGADHLVAMVPSSITRTKTAIRNGLLWGIGHSSGLILLTLLAFLIKDRAKVFSDFSELLVGISLLIVGVFAIKKALNLSIHSHSHKHKNGIAHEHLHFHSKKLKKHNKHSHALTFLGLFHGIAGGSHSMAAIGLSTLPTTTAIICLGSYLSGSLISMILFSFFISSSILFSGQKYVKRLMVLTGGLSFLIGMALIQQQSTILFFS